MVFYDRAAGTPLASEREVPNNMDLMLRSSSHRAAIILAGGEGVRLRSVTRLITGQDDVPKQFCPMMDGLTWLETTRRRVARLVPLERTFFVVKQGHRRFYEPLLEDPKRSQILAQPCDRGIAAAMLYGVVRARRLGPDATVGVFPSDHYVSDDERFIRQVEHAFDAVDRYPTLAVLLGIVPDRAEPSYGWIEPARQLSSWTPNLFRVRRFWEKPSPQFARSLMAGGCLWNSAVIVARASALETMIAESSPDMARALAALARAGVEDDRAFEAAFTRLPTVGFSEHVLAQGPSNLAVQRVEGVGWSDVGEPQRLIDTLQGLKSRPAWFDNLTLEYRKRFAGRMET